MIGSKISRSVVLDVSEWMLEVARGGLADIVAAGIRYALPSTSSESGMIVRNHKGIPVVVVKDLRRSCPIMAGLYAGDGVVVQRNFNTARALLDLFENQNLFLLNVNDLVLEENECCCDKRLQVMRDFVCPQCSFMVDCAIGRARCGSLNMSRSRNNGMERIVPTTNKCDRSECELMFMGKKLYIHKIDKTYFRIARKMLLSPFS